MAARDPDHLREPPPAQHHPEAHSPAAEVGADEITPAPEAEHTPARGEGEHEAPGGHQWWQDES